MAAASSLSELFFLSLFAIFMFPAVLGDDARNPVGTHQQPTSNTLPLLQHSHGDVAENHGFGDPNSYDRALRLRLPSEKNLPIATDNPRMQPNDVYAEWQRRFRAFDMHFQGEFGRSRLDERDLIFRRFRFGCRWPFRFGRHGGCDHGRCKHYLMFLMRRGCYGRRHFPGRTGRDLNTGFSGAGNPSHVALL